jgi:hypothetical protein
MLRRIDRRATEWRLVDGEVIALQLDRKEYFTINPSGTLLWPLLAQGATEAELSAALVHAFGLSQGAARADVAAFLAVLRDRGLLEEEIG